MGIIDDIKNVNDYSIFPKKDIEERLKDLACPIKDYSKAMSIDKEFQSNIHKLYNLELLEEMKEYSKNFDRVMALGYALLATDKYKKWNYYGSAKVRRIDAGVKTLQFSQQNINSILKNRR